MDQSFLQHIMLERENALPQLFSRENETYAKLELVNGEHEKQIIYVKGTWYPTHFIMSVLDGQDTWNFNATQEFVEHEANKLGLKVKEWLDRVHTYFCHQHVENNYSYVYIGPDSKMLQCSYFDKTLGERHSIKLMLYKISNCGEVAYEMLGLLVDTNAKQQEEIAQKTCDIQKMVAEIRELRLNPKEHYWIEHDPLEPLRGNKMLSNQRFEAENVNEIFLSNNEHHEEQYRQENNWENSKAINNTQYWTYDTSEDNLHPTLKPLIDHHHIDDFSMQNQQPYHFSQSISNHQDIHETHKEGGESSSFGCLEELNDVNYNASLQTNQNQGSHHFSYVVPCHYVEGLLKKHPQKNKVSEPKNDQATMYLYIAPKNIFIEKKIVIDADFEEKISMSRSTSREQNNKSNKANWSLNPPILDNEIFYNDEHPPHIIAKSSQNENNDQLSIKLEIFDHMPRFEGVTNDMNDIQHTLFDDTKIKHESIVQHNETKNTNDQSYSKVNFHHTTQDEKKGKVYYKTPKHSYARSKNDAHGYNDDEEFDSEVLSHDMKRSYVVNNFYKYANYGRNSRWSSSSQLALHDDNYDFKVEPSCVGNQKDEENDTNSSERLYAHYENVPNDISKNNSHNIDSNISQVQWNSDSSSNIVQTPTNSIEPNNESFNKTYPTSESNLENEYNDNNLSLINHPIHSILHHSGEQHPHHEHIIWGENSASDGQQELQTKHNLVVEEKLLQFSHVQESMQPNVSTNQLTENNNEDDGQNNNKGDGQDNGPNNNEDGGQDDGHNDGQDDGQNINKHDGQGNEQYNNKDVVQNNNNEDGQNNNKYDAQNIIKEDGQNNNKDDRQSQELIEEPTLMSRFFSPFESSLNQTISDNTNESTIDNSVENSTHASLEFEETKDKTIEKLDETTIYNTKDIVHQNKNVKYSKSTSFVQSFLSLFQGSSNNTQDEKSHQNKNKTQSSISIDQKVNENESSTQSKFESKNSQDESNNVSVSTIFSSFHEPQSFQPLIAQSHVESIKLNELREEDNIQNKNVLDEGSENESIDDEEFYKNLPHRNMDACRKASIDEVRKELFLKFGKQEEFEGTPPLDNLKDNALGHDSQHTFVRLGNNKLIKVENFDKFCENRKEETSHVLLQNPDHEPRRYSIDKIDSNELKDMHQRPQSTSISRTSLYSKLHGQPSKATINSQVSRSNESITNTHEVRESNTHEVRESNTHEVRESKDLENGLESQVKLNDDESIIHSKQTSFDKSDNEENISFNHNNNENKTNAFNNKVVETLMPSISQIPTSNSENQRSNRSSTLSTNNDNDANKGILCVARIRFVFPGKSTTLPTLQNHATTSTSSTPNTGDFNVGIKFNNEK